MAGSVGAVEGVCACTVRAVPNVSAVIIAMMVVVFVIDLLVCRFDIRARRYGSTVDLNNIRWIERLFADLCFQPRSIPLKYATTTPQVPHLVSGATDVTKFSCCHRCNCTAWT